MANLLATDPIVFHHVGTKSGKTYTGTFNAYQRLTHRLSLLKGRKYRELLGTNSDEALEDDKLRAEILAELSVSFSTYPTWWGDSEFGLDLEDDSLVVALYNEVLQIRNKAIESLQKKANDATVELKKALEVEQKK